MVRKLFAIDEENIKLYVPELGATLGETLLTPTKLYVKPVLALLDRCEVKAISHITGGGFFENIPRMLKSGLTAKVEIASIPKLPIFDLMQKKGDIPTREMYNTFNMGVGMCIAVAKEQVDIALSALKEADTNAFVMGEVVPGEEGVILC